MPNLRNYSMQRLPIHPSKRPTSQRPPPPHPPPHPPHTLRLIPLIEHIPSTSCILQEQTIMDKNDRGGLACHFPWWHGSVFVLSTSSLQGPEPGIPKPWYTCTHLLPAEWKKPNILSTNTIFQMFVIARAHQILWCKLFWCSLKKLQVVKWFKMDTLLLLNGQIYEARSHPFLPTHYEDKAVTVDEVRWGDFSACSI